MFEGDSPTTPQQSPSLPEETRQDVATRLRQEKATASQSLIDQGLDHPSPVQPPSDAIAIQEAQAVERGLLNPKDESSEEIKNRLRQDKNSDIELTQILENEGREAFIVAKRDLLLEKAIATLGDENVAVQKVDDVMRKLFIYDEIKTAKNKGLDVDSPDVIGDATQTADARLIDFKERYKKSNSELAADAVTEVVDNVDFKTFLLFLIGGGSDHGSYTQHASSIENSDADNSLVKSIVNARHVAELIGAGAQSIGLNKDEIQDALSKSELSVYLQKNVLFDDSKTQRLLYEMLKAMGRNADARAALMGDATKAKSMMMEISEQLDKRRSAPLSVSRIDPQVTLPKAA